MIKKINKLSILYPGGNTTAIVQDEIKPEWRPIVAEKICKIYKQVEQIGFEEKPINQLAIARLQMLGGEFCGNSTLCFGKLKLKPKTNNYLEISGAKKPLKIKRNGLVSAQMPIRQKAKIKTTKEGFNFIKLDGIYQIITNRFYNRSDQWQAKKTLEIIKTNKLENKLATVVSFIKPIDNKVFNKPYCYFKKDFKYQVFKETSCGSASTAIGLLNYRRLGQRKIEIIQPTGASTFVEIKINNEIWIKTKIKLIYQGGLNLL